MDGQQQFPPQQTAHEVTTGELVRTLGQLRDTLNQISTKFDAYVLKEVYDIELRELRTDINGVADNQRWLARTVGGAILTAIVAFLFAGGVLGGK